MLSLPVLMLWTECLKILYANRLVDSLHQAFSAGAKLCKLDYEQQWAVLSEC